MTATVEQPRLIPDILPEVARKVVLVALDDLPEDEFLWGPAPTTGMVDSVRTMGILYPVLIERDGTEATLDVRDGRRRVKAARIVRAELMARYEAAPTPESKKAFQASQKVPCLEVTEGDGVGQAMLEIAANIHSANAMTDLEGIERLLKYLRARDDGDADNATNDELKAVAKASGLQYGTVVKRYELHYLTEDIRSAVGAGKIAPGVAARIAKLTPKQQDVLSAVLSENGKVRASDVTGVTRAARKEAGKKLDLGFLGQKDAVLPGDPLGALTSSAELALRRALTIDGKSPEQVSHESGMLEFVVLAPDGTRYVVDMTVRRDAGQ